MGQQNFWDNPERAQKVIQQLKPLNAILKPFDDLCRASEDLKALAELSEEERNVVALSAAAPARAADVRLDLP